MGQAIFKNSQNVVDDVLQESLQVPESDIDRAVNAAFIENRKFALWHEIVPLAIIGLCAVLGTPSALIWILIAIQFAWALCAEVWTKRCLRANSEHLINYVVLFAFVEGLIWGGMMQPFAQTLGSDIASTFVCTTLIVTVSFACMVHALSKAWVSAYFGGFLIALLPQCLYYMNIIGPLPFFATLSLIPALLSLSTMVRRQMRGIVATKLQNEQLSKRLSDALEVSTYLARRDALTGLLNRRAFEEDANTLSAHERSEGCLALILLDLDHFKQINDTFGHSTGDEVLKKTANCLESALQQGALIGRSDTAIARWGGEEFIVLVETCDLLSAAQVTEFIRLSVIEARAPDWPNDMLVTGSFGVALWEEGLDLGELINRADQAMYSAKVAGRNRTRVYHSAGLLPIEFLEGEARAAKA